MMGLPPTIDGSDADGGTGAGQCLNRARLDSKGLGGA